MTLLEALARCVQLREPALLVGETGVGKTAAVSYLSSLVGSKLVTLNLSQQSDSFDLLGGLASVCLHCVSRLCVCWLLQVQTSSSLSTDGSFKGKIC